MKYPHVDNRLIHDYSDLVQSLEEFLVKFPYFHFQSRSLRINEILYHRRIRHKLFKCMALDAIDVSDNTILLANKNAATQPRCYRI